MWKRVAIGAVMLASSLFVVSQAGANVFWETESEIDPFTDIRKGSACLQSFEGEASLFCVRCIDNVLEILIGYDVQLDSEMDVTSRVGKRKSDTRLWDSSTTGDALFHMRPRNLLQQLLADSQHTFAVRVWASDGYKLDAIFDTSNIDNAMDVIREAGCLPQLKPEPEAVE